MIPIVCPSCAVPISAPNEAAGKAAKCPRCRKVIRIPELTTFEAIAPEPARPPARGGSGMLVAIVVGVVACLGVGVAIGTWMGLNTRPESPRTLPIAAKESPREVVAAIPKPPEQPVGPPTAKVLTPAPPVGDAEVRRANLATAIKEHRVAYLRSVYVECEARRVGSLSKTDFKAGLDILQRIKDGGLDKVTKAEMLAAKKVAPDYLIGVKALAGLAVDADKLDLWDEYRRVYFSLHPEDLNDPKCIDCLSNESLEKDFRERWSGKGR